MEEKKSGQVATKKSNKPMIERRRRARINDCLQQLKEIIVQERQLDSARGSRLEKADILEMTVDYIRRFSQDGSSSPFLQTAYELGVERCVQEISQFMRSQQDFVDVSITQSLANHCRKILRNDANTKDKVQHLAGSKRSIKPKLETAADSSTSPKRSKFDKEDDYCLSTRADNDSPESETHESREKLQTEDVSSTKSTCTSSIESNSHEVPVCFPSAPGCQRSPAHRSSPDLCHLNTTSQGETDARQHTDLCRDEERALIVSHLVTTALPAGLPERHVTTALPAGLPERHVTTSLPAELPERHVTTSLPAGLPERHVTTNHLYDMTSPDNSSQHQDAPLVSVVTTPPLPHSPTTNNVGKSLVFTSCPGNIIILVDQTTILSHPLPQHLVLRPTFPAVQNTFTLIPTPVLFKPVINPATIVNNELADTITSGSCGQSVTTVNHFPSTSQSSLPLFPGHGVGLKHESGNIRWFPQEQNGERQYSFLPSNIRLGQTACIQISSNTQETPSQTSSNTADIPNQTSSNTLNISSQTSLYTPSICNQTSSNVLDISNNTSSNMKSSFTSKACTSFLDVSRQPSPKDLDISNHHSPTKQNLHDHPPQKEQDYRIKTAQKEQDYRIKIAHYNLKVSSKTSAKTKSLVTRNKLRIANYAACTSQDKLTINTDHDTPQITLSSDQDKLTINTDHDTPQITLSSDQDKLTINTDHDTPQITLSSHQDKLTINTDHDTPQITLSSDQDKLTINTDHDTPQTTLSSVQDKLTINTDHDTPHTTLSSDQVKPLPNSPSITLSEKTALNLSLNNKNYTGKTHGEYPTRHDRSTTEYPRQSLRLCYQVPNVCTSQTSFLYKGHPCHSSSSTEQNNSTANSPSGSQLIPACQSSDEEPNKDTVNERNKLIKLSATSSLVHQSEVATSRVGPHLLQSHYAGDEPVFGCLQEYGAALDLSRRDKTTSGEADVNNNMSIRGTEYGSRREGQEHQCMGTYNCDRLDDQNLSDLSLNCLVNKGTSSQVCNNHASQMSSYIFVGAEQVGVWRPWRDSS